MRPCCISGPLVFVGGQDQFQLSLSYCGTGRKNTHSLKDTVQLVNMGMSPSGCDSLPKYPTPIFHAIGGLVDNQLIICAGQDSDIPYVLYNTWATYSNPTSCYKFETTNHKWTLFAKLLTSRTSQASTTMHDGSLWITGKGDGAYLLRSAKPLPADVKTAVCKLAQNRAQIFFGA